MLLFTPGPTPVLEKIRVTMSTPTIHHRTPEFEDIFKQTREKLQKLMRMQEVLMLASSGTGAMEACVLNLCKSHALTINAGKFGERFGKIAKSFEIPYTELKYSWDTPTTKNDVINAIKANPKIDAFFIQVCESAGGLRHPVEEISKAIKEINPDIMVVADGITAVGVEEIDTTNIDALITGSQKAFMLPPGLAMIGVSQKAISKIENSPKGFYFNLSTELKNQRKNTTAYTAATTLIIGLKAMLEEIENIGTENFYKFTKLRAEASLESLKSIGMKIYPSKPAIAMSTIYHEKAKNIRSVLKTKYSVNVAGGQDDLQDFLIRINNMGIIPFYETSWVLNSLELVLDEMNLRKYDGNANRVFSQIMYEGLR